MQDLRFYRVPCSSWAGQLLTLPSALCRRCGFDLEISCSWRCQLELPGRSQRTVKGSVKLLNAASDDLDDLEVSAALPDALPSSHGGPQARSAPLQLCGTSRHQRWTCGHFTLGDAVLTGVLTQLMCSHAMPAVPT